uniref:Uncharacterized protein n=1 Tax=Oryzias sinensis TaxID=183150 RepID=A0A8C7YIT7_9TELE
TGLLEPILAAYGRRQGDNLDSSPISEAFKRFGISHQDRSLLVVVVHSRDDSEVLSHIAVRVDGQEVPVEEFSSFSDPAKIRKLYKVSPQEEESGGLLDAVVCRMATKDVM